MKGKINISRKMRSFTIVENHMLIWWWMVLSKNSWNKKRKKRGRLFADRIVYLRTALLLSPLLKILDRRIIIKITNFLKVARLQPLNPSSVPLEKILNLRRDLFLIAWTAILISSTMFLNLYPDYSPILRN
jgi:hypothetical protein